MRMIRDYQSNIDARKSYKATTSHVNWSDWISKQIAIFGRHANKRPKHLSVSANGTIVLKELMQVWGIHHDLKDIDVINAVQANMLHRDGHPRFSLSNDADGAVTIRVLPKLRNANFHSGTSNQWHRNRESAWASYLGRGYSTQPTAQAAREQEYHRSWWCTEVNGDVRPYNTDAEGV